VPYSTQECITIQEPYTTQECHTIQVPESYENCTSVDFDYEIKNIKEEPWHIIYHWDTRLIFDIENHEDQGGYFIYETTFQNASGPIHVGPYKEYINAHSTETLTLIYDSGQGEDVTFGDPVVTPPQKQVCEEGTTYIDEQQCEWVIKYTPKQQCETVTRYRTEYRCGDVTKYRTEEQCETVTKYREVEKTRTVTKYRTETERSFNACFG